MVLVDRDVCVSRIKNIPKKQTKPDKILKFKLKDEKCIDVYLKTVKSSGSLAADQNENIKAGGSRPSILYNLSNINQAIIDVFHLLVLDWQQ